MTERLLIVGNGMASVRLVEEILRNAPGKFAITVVGGESRPGYNRVLLSALLAGDLGAADIMLKEQAWYEAMGVTLITGRKVEKLCSSKKQAMLDDGSAVAFDRCVFATGSSALRLPMPGADLPGVIGFRDLDDVTAMEEAAAGGGRIAVIGGGLLGIEAAYGLARRGAAVTLIHVSDRLMDRQLDDKAAALLKAAMERKGVEVQLDRQTRAVTGTRAATGLAFADGGSLRADLVVMAVGIQARTELAAAAGLGVNRGNLVDDNMATTLPGVYAVGECAEHRGQVYGLVEPAYAQAAALARHLAGDASQPFEGMVLATNLKVSGVPVFSAGDFFGAPGTQTIIYEDSSPAEYRKLVFSGNRLTGAVLFGETGDALWYRDLIRSGADIGAMRSDLIFGQRFAEGVGSEAA